MIRSHLTRHTACTSAARLAGRLTLACLALAAGASPAFAQGMPPAPVEVAPVVARDVAPRRSFVGTVRAHRIAIVGAEVEGRVEALLVRDGDAVKQGAPVASLRTKGIELDLHVSRAELELRQSELAELENGSRAEDVRQAEARVASADAELAYARWNHDSTARLRESGTLSEGEGRRVALALAAAEQGLRQAQAALDLLRAGPRRERITQARARVAAQEAAIARLEEDLARHTITAPFDGVIVAERTEVGQWLSRGAAVVELVALDVVEVRVGVVEDAVGTLVLGDAAVVEIDALPGRTFEGRIHAIVPRGDERTRTFPVDVRVTNTTGPGGPELKAGMFARVSLAVGAPVASLVVPKDALVLGGQTPIVFVAKPGAEGEPMKAVPVPVRTGAADGGMVVVVGGVAEGDLVVTRGNERLRPGQDIVPAPAKSASGGPAPGRPTPPSDR